MGKQIKPKKISELKITMTKLKKMLATMIKQQAELISALTPAKKTRKK